MKKNVNKLFKGRKNMLCWEFFDCPENIRDNCKVYLNWKHGISMMEPWLHYDPSIGGPAKRGPCIECRMTSILFPEIANLFDD